MLSHRLAVLAVVAVAFAPALLRLPHMEVSRSPMQLVPRGHEAGLGFARLLDKFGAGMLWPTKVLVLPPPGETVFSESFFKRVASVVESLPSQLPLSPRYSVQSLVYSSDAGGAIPFATVRAALPELRDAGHGDGAELLCDVAAGAVGMDACQLIRLARQKFVNANGTAMVLNIALDSDPWTPASTRWLHSLRRACEIFGGSTDQYLVVSNPSSVNDTVDGVYASAPLVVLVTGCGVFAIVSASFRSVVVPLRLLPSIALTIIWTYGLAVMVYQDGVLAGLGISCLSPIGHGGIPGVSWVLPPICFTLLTGLCLDYDSYGAQRYTP
ncbi:unnamed protein product [Prorocentrum cordatum]|uniref:Membrane transport protein MMPL domain-containing protein n=1 Tax=Prorocentrum cordatum TaxID=2364126 RepID=A0ABN9W9Y2_9DINO|nr:unnamed protein product [Polarella glacialis]